MSVKWGGLSVDSAFRFDEGCDDQGGTAIVEDERGARGAWPSEMDDIEFYAESAMTLPGMGNVGERCGEWYPSEFCDACGEPHFGVSRCNRRECPNCGNTSWRRRRAEKITRRLGAARHAAIGGLSKRAVHAVMSPPPGKIRTLTDVSQGFRYAYQLAREKGVRGGVAVFHGFRVKPEVLDTFRELADAGMLERGIWKWVREHDHDFRDLTYWSPHWHIIGICRDFESNEPDEQGGWVAQRVRTLKPFKLYDLGGYQDMVGVSVYLLSHATFESDTSKHCIRWFGDLATTKFRAEDELSEGSLSVVERKAREAAKVGSEQGENPLEDDDPKECENCGATSRSSIWEAGAALLDQRWCERIGREQQHRLQVAYKWAVGDLKPPPGMRQPKTKQQAVEVFETMVN